jgi:hypothetical protein
MYADRTVISASGMIAFRRMESSIPHNTADVARQRIRHIHAAARGENSTIRLNVVRGVVEGTLKTNASECIAVVSQEG